MKAGIWIGTGDKARYTYVLSAWQPNSSPHLMHDSHSHTHGITLVAPRPSGSLTGSQARNGPFCVKRLHLLTNDMQVFQFLLFLSSSPCMQWRKSRTMFNELLDLKYHRSSQLVSPWKDIRSSTQYCLFACAYVLTASSSNCSS